MLTEERQQQILTRLEQSTIVKTQDLISQLHASESTIRRDLQELEDAGLLLRIHGGAKKKNLLAEEAALSDKNNTNTQSKIKIAEFASQMIDQGDVIYLDAGSSTYHMIPYLTNKNITVVTNSAQHAALLSEANVSTIMLGGTIKLKTNAIIGATALTQLTHYRFDKVFIGTNGLHVEHGLTTPDPEEAILKEAAVARGTQVYALVDNTKFNQTFFVKFADLTQVTILTTICPEAYRTINNQNITILEAEQ